MKKLLPGWYVAYTRPNHERKVLAGLAEKEMQTFFPTVKKLRNWHDRIKCIDEPLFRSYIFVYLKDSRDHTIAQNVEGVLYFVTMGKEIARVDERIILNIRTVIGKGIEMEVVDTTFRPGQEMTIVQGPLAGLQCEIVELATGKRLLVRVNLLKRNVLVNLKKEYLSSMSKVASV